MRPFPAAALSFSCALAAAFIAGSCSSSLDVSNPFEKPDPIVQMRAANAPAPHRAVVVVGRVENPPSSPLSSSWPDIGAGFAETLRGRLAAQGGLAVQVHDGLSNRIAGAVLRPGPQADRDAALAAARREFPDVDYVIVGRVLDFHHSADVLPVEARKTLLGGTRNQAVTAADVTIVDLRTGRIALAERFTGAADAPEQPTAQQYRAISGPSSALFANSPLGRASSQAASRVVSRLAVLAPAQAIELKVIRGGTRGGREIIAGGGSEHGIMKGQRYFVCRRDPATARVQAVRDEAMHTDLQAEVIATNERTSTLWLLGRPPASIALSECILLRERP